MRCIKEVIKILVFVFAFCFLAGKCIDVKKEITITEKQNQLILEVQKNIIYAIERL